MNNKHTARKKYNYSYSPMKIDGDGYEDDAN